MAEFNLDAVVEKAALVLRAYPNGFQFKTWEQCQKAARDMIKASGLLEELEGALPYVPPASFTAKRIRGITGQPPEWI